MSKNSFLFVLIVLTSFTFIRASFAFDTSAQAAYVIDQETGTILLAKNETVALPPASMSKLMTLYMAFEALRDGRLRWDEKLRVSEHAMSYRGSTMFLDTSDRVTVQDLIRGIIVLSGNDACVVIAEALSVDGTEKGFATMMTAKAKKLGMHHSVFANANGWPHPSQRMSIKDLAIIAGHIITDFPTQYLLFAEKEFAFDGRAPSNTQNRNPLLKLDIGADGLKTGHTSEAGYGLVGSARQGDRRVIFVLTGLESANARAMEAERIVNWSFRNFTSKTLSQSGSIIAYADVWMGKSRTVGMTLEAGVSILVPTSSMDEISSKVVYQGPLQAPIVTGENIGELIISIPGMPQKNLKLVAAEPVAIGGLISRIRTVALVLLRKVGWGSLDA